MKTLIIIRHAKSSWEYDVEDKQRPLNSRGLKDAERVSKHFKNQMFTPDAVFSSPAKRALTTCKIFLKNLNIDEKRLKIESALYDFGGQSVTLFLKQLDKKLDKVVIFGHNHAFNSIANRFGSEFIDNLPTCGLVKMEFDIDNWSDLETGKTTYMLFPRDLK